MIPLADGVFRWFYATTEKRAEPQKPCTGDAVRASRVDGSHPFQVSAVRAAENGGADGYNSSTVAEGTSGTAGARRGGAGARAILLMPGAQPFEPMEVPPVHELSIQDWSDFIARSDDPEILVGPAPNGQGATIRKIFHRKLRYAISGSVQQKVWVSDGLRCRYCGVKMGAALLTVDHFQPLELGGANDESNFLTACKRCNKRKGSRDPDEFCAEIGISADDLREYLKSRKL